ncbi:hypothetical protein SELMODRAFT_168303 [Selaginella moellendorffii]|uniref:Acylamino-acid-releasing enzyme n=1 Tax=Selaginella moellendorffii TaxID=88036 RepID=D8R6F0_SELML|nr:acylamino-acid-releasing enzyme 1 [Selaginella moellendorffii]EFJ32660.1 hypothetical protein SELMODRAFT_168303 [Selaginella moellendorffii]|eukprot:XP_002966633.1 acylamino-acid-releasing enzyme 1 [Selaginella moellendorffii]
MELAPAILGSNSAAPQAPQDRQLAKQSELLQSFFGIPSIDKAWASPSPRGNGLDVVVAMSQIDLPGNAKRNFMSHLYLPEAGHGLDPATNCHWSPFPIQLSGASLVVPSPSGSKVLVVCNTEPASKDSPCSVKLQIWGPMQLLKEVHVPSKLHGSVYTDGWFEGVSWSHDERFIAYVAEEPPVDRPVFGQAMGKDGQKQEGEAGTWKGQGDWMEDWGECYAGKRRPLIYVADTNSGSVQAVEGIPQDLSAGQVVWAPSSSEGTQYLVFVAWSSFADNFKTPRKLGMKYCYNRPCALYATAAPMFGSHSLDRTPGAPLKLTATISSAFSPRFSPDGEFLVFLSAKAAVDSGAHCATNSLHCVKWSGGDSLGTLPPARDVVPVISRPDAKGFPGLYCSTFLSHPWLYDNRTLLLTSAWRSTQVIVSVNLESGEVLRLTPEDSISSWSLLSVFKNILLAVASNPGSPPDLKIAYCSSMEKISDAAFQWSDIPTPVEHTEEVQSILSSISSRILQIPVPSSDGNEILPQGAKDPFEAIFVSPGEVKEGSEPPPLVLVLHGGPHSVSVTGFSRNYAFLVGLGFSLLHVNYRGSLGFGEEALQCLLGNVGRRDVNDVLTALDVVLAEGLAKPDKVAVVGGSHGGFLTSHLIGQAPGRFVTGIVRNPVCNISSMVGITDIPDWCYMESYGKAGLNLYDEAPSVKHLGAFYQASPIAHVDKVQVPTMFLLGAQDRRVPVSNGLQYAQALRARGLEVKVIVFPDDIHAIDRPQSDFESFVNIGAWLKRFT